MSSSLVTSPTHCRWGQSLLPPGADIFAAAVTGERYKAVVIHEPQQVEKHKRRKASWRFHQRYWRWAVCFRKSGRQTDIQLNT